MTYKRLSVIVLLFIINPSSSTAQIFRPYKCGPVLKIDNIQTFDTLNQFLGLRAGHTFAEIGASSGYYNGAMAMYLDSITFYLQDVDESCLNQENLDKVLRYYSKFRKTPITETNTFHIAIGTNTRTNLPENSFDIIYSNATFHVLDYPDSIIVDLYGRLKDLGILSIRDEFVHDGSTQYCKDKKCGNPLTNYQSFLEIMDQSGFLLIDISDQFGYPVYKFRKK